MYILPKNQYNKPNTTKGVYKFTQNELGIRSVLEGKKDNQVRVLKIPFAGEYTRGNSYLEIDLSPLYQPQTVQAIEYNINKVLDDLAVKVYIKKGIHKERRNIILDRMDFDAPLTKSQAERLKYTYERIFSFWQNKVRLKNPRVLATQTRYYKNLVNAYKRIIAGGKMVKGKFKVSKTQYGTIIRNATNMFRAPFYAGEYGNAKVRTIKNRLVNKSPELFVDTGGTVNAIVAVPHKITRPRKNKLLDLRRHKMARL